MSVMPRRKGAEMLREPKVQNRSAAEVRKSRSAETSPGEVTAGPQAPAACVRKAAKRTRQAQALHAQRSPQQPHGVEVSEDPGNSTAHSWEAANPFCSLEDGYKRVALAAFRNHGGKEGGADPWKEEALGERLTNSSFSSVRQE